MYELYEFCNYALVCYCCVFFFKQKTAYEMRISDWSSDVCSSDLPLHRHEERAPDHDDRRYPERPSSVEEHALVPQARRLQAVSADTERRAMPSFNIICHTNPLTDSQADSLVSYLASWSPVVEIGRASCRERVCQFV